MADIQPVVWDKSAFGNLSLEENTKELIEALVRNKVDSDQSIDFVKGKGAGQIVLLHGGPGTGKTLTAETVAKIAERPLYRVTRGAMGFIRNLETVKDPTAIEDIKSHLVELSKFRMNGRQIRDAINTTRQLARFKKRL